MNLMLTFIFACVVLGLLTRGLGRREYLGIGLMATAMIGLYFFFQRFL
jgi:hypothetical protein